MRLGLHALGIGNGADRAVIDAVAAAADRAGFATLWSGEHVVMVDESASRYPYSDDGRIAVPAEADWIDPLIGLSFAAAATSTIRIAHGCAAAARAQSGAGGQAGGHAGHAERWPADARHRHRLVA